MLGLKQMQAAELLGVDQPKISALSRGLLDGFSLERLIGYLPSLRGTPKQSRKTRGD